jgi:stearoyl-CoA desaturase (delta-9 desaturase)
MKTYFRLNTLPFWIIHSLSLGVLFLPWSWSGPAIALVSYYSRMFFVTAGYHRYFSHRAYHLGRIPQFLLAFFAMTSSQKGVLWWASHHREHHRHSDQAGDIHSPKEGFLWSHMGWMLSDRYSESQIKRIPDFARFPELVWLDRHWTVPVWFFGIALYLMGGWFAVIWGLCVGTVLLWHGTFTINSLSHIWGRRRYPTTDTSRNNGVLSLITLGEGWHNNHHHFPSAARNGFFWWELDVTYYGIRLLEMLGVASRLVQVPERILKPKG